MPLSSLDLSTIPFGNIHGKYRMAVGRVKTLNYEKKYKDAGKHPAYLQLQYVLNIYITTL